MKKTLSILFAMWTLNVLAFPIFTIVDNSWKDSSFVSYGSMQWVDVVEDLKNGYSTSDSANIYIFESLTEHTSNPVYRILTRMSYIKKVNGTTVWQNGQWVFTPTDSVGYLSYPLNADGKSRRIYFKMPMVFPVGMFAVNVMVGVDVTGYFHSTTGIENYSFLQKDVKEVVYYNLAGQVTADISGVCIKQVTYSDGIVERKKIFFQKTFE